MAIGIAAPIPSPKPANQGRPPISNQQGEPENRTAQIQNQGNATVLQIPSPLKVKAECDHGCGYSEDDKSWWSKLWTDPVATFTAVLALFALAQVYWMQRTVRDTAEQHRVTERAFVILKNFRSELTTAAHYKRLHSQPTSDFDALTITRFALQPLWENVGNTPTKNMTIQVDWRFASPQDVGTYRADPEPFFVAPKAFEPSEIIEVTGLGTLINGGHGTLEGVEPLVLIWGRTEYDDIFGKHHWLQWCYRLRPERHRGDDLEVHYIPWGDYNGSD